MPWCEECSHYFTPSAMNADGTCPQCGALIEDQRPKIERPVAGSDEQAADEDDAKAPWHFKLMIVLLVLYLAWRFYQLIF